METVLYLRHGIPPTMPLPPETANKLYLSSRRSSSLSLSSGHKKTLRGNVIECSNGKNLERQASFKSTGTRLGALKSLLDVKTCLDSHRSDTPNSQEPTSYIGDKSSHSVNEFKKNLVRQMGPEKAIEVLEKELQKGHMEFDIALAEILVCEGRFKEALERDCLKESHPSDLRFKLYKAIIHTMLAHSFWQEFLNSPEIPDLVDDVEIEIKKD